MRGAKKRRLDEWIEVETARLRKELKQMPELKDGSCWWQEIQLNMLTRGTLLSWQHAKRRMRLSKLTTSQRKRRFAKYWMTDHPELRRAYAAKQRPRR